MRRRQNKYQRNKKIAKYMVFAAIGIILGTGVIGYPKVASFIERLRIEEENKVICKGSYTAYPDPNAHLM